MPLEIVLPKAKTAVNLTVSSDCNPVKSLKTE